jgi:flagellar hook-associated protein 1 FlgK
MSLWGTLNVARTGLSTSQAALQTVGNNIANAGDENYTRHVVTQRSTTPQEVRAGLFVGTGVDVKSIERQIDESVEQRLRASLADSKGAANTSQWLTRLESVYNELSDEDLSTGMSAFFNAWSDLANKPEDAGLRQVVVQSGETLANQFQATRQQVVSLRTELNGSVEGYAKEANELAQQVADLNKRIAVAEKGAGRDSGLRDVRDAVLKDLSSLLNVTTGNGDNGMVNVYVGSEPLVMNGQSRGLALRRDADVPLSSGILGSAKDVMNTIGGALGHVDDLAKSLVFELNKLHASGQGTAGFASATAENAVSDTSARLDSKAADLDFKPANGSFVVHVKDKATGASSSTLIQVDLDNADGTGTTLDSLRAALDGIGDVSASINAGKLTIASETNATEISFSQDSSGVLAALGINNFFSGSDARDIAVSKAVSANPSRINAAAHGQPADNGTAKRIAALQDAAIAALGGKSLTQSYEGQVTNVASKLEAANNAATAAGVVLDTMQGQRDAISGVNLDEEAIAMMRYQRAYQASSRVIAATDEMLQTILGLV